MQLDQLLKQMEQPEEQTKVASDATPSTVDKLSAALNKVAGAAAAEAARIPIQAP